MLLLVKLHKIHYDKKEDVPFLSEIAVSMPWNMIVFLSGLAVIICWKWLKTFLGSFCERHSTEITMLLILEIVIVIVYLECKAVLMGTSPFSSKALGTILILSLVLPYKLEFSTNGPRMDISMRFSN